MGFRDDREAVVQRVDVLERELASTKNELEAALLRAGEVDDLRKRVVDLTRERDALRTDGEPGWATRRRVIGFGALLAVAVVVVVAYVVDDGLRHELRVATAVRTLAENARAQAESDLETTRQERDAARNELRQIDQAHDEVMADLQRQLDAARTHETPPAQH